MTTLSIKGFLIEIQEKERERCVKILERLIEEHGDTKNATMLLRLAIHLIQKP